MKEIPTNNLVLLIVLFLVCLIGYMWAQWLDYKENIHNSIKEDAKSERDRVFDAISKTVGVNEVREVNDEKKYHSSLEKTYYNMNKNLNKKE